MSWRPEATRTSETTRRASAVGSTPASPTKKAANSERSNPIDTQSRNPIIPEGYEDILESTTLAHIATIGPHGEPQNNPVCFGWDGEHVKFSQTKTRQKYRNVQRHPRVALSLVDPDNPYRYLEVRGKVVRIDEDPDLDFKTRWRRSTSAWTSTRTTGPATSVSFSSSGRTTRPRWADSELGPATRGGTCRRARKPYGWAERRPARAGLPAVVQA